MSPMVAPVASRGPLALCARSFSVALESVAMCSCVDVDFGTYANAVALYPPEDLGITRVPATVDRCLADEVQALWAQGIVTTGSCCGHNKMPGMISVADDSVATMLSLGYQPCLLVDGFGVNTFYATPSHEPGLFLPKGDDSHEDGLDG